MRRSTWSSSPNASQAPAPRAPSTPTPWASSTISRAPCCWHSSTIAGQVADVALHRVDAVHHHQHAAAVVGGALQHLVELVEPVVAERPQPRPRHHHAVHDRGVVAGVADHGVARAEQRRQAAHVGLVAGGEDDRVAGAHPLGDLALELLVERRGAVQEARAGKAGAVGLERLAGRLLHARVAGEAEVVVGARASRAPCPPSPRPGPASRLDQPEVGEEVVLARGLELLHPLVRAGLLE